MSKHVTLRAANVARQAEWPGAEAVTLAFRGVELAGETGEACNIIKKLERERLGISGSRGSLADLAIELADVVICADLIAMDAGINLEAAVAYKFNETSKEVGLATRLVPPPAGDDFVAFRALTALLALRATRPANHADGDDPELAAAWREADGAIEALQAAPYRTA